METFLADLAYSLRLFRRAPGFTLAAVAALALGIGANTAIFSVVNAVLLKPVPFPEPDRLVMFTNTGPQGEFPGASPAKFAHWRQQADVVQDVTAFRSNVVNDTSGGAPQQLRAAQVSADYFRLFGAPLVRGRGFADEEDRPSGARVAIISYGLWQRRVGGDPASATRAARPSCGTHGNPSSSLPASHCLRYLFRPFNRTMSFVVVVRATASRLPSCDQAKSRMLRSVKCVS